MEGKKQMTASVYFNEAETANNQTTKNPRKKNKKIAYKIQYCNQNLEDAIKEVRTYVKENPEWRMNVKAVTDQYKIKKDGQSQISEIQRNQDAQNSPALLAHSRGEPPINVNLKDSNMSKKIYLQKLKFTERMKKQYDDRLKQIKQKRMRVEGQLLEQQMKARLERRIQQNLKLKEKRSLLKQLQEKREQALRLNQIKQKQKNKQITLLHQSNVAKVEMLRRQKKKIHKKQLSQSKSLSQSSALDHRFKQFQTSQCKIQKKQLLQVRYRNLRCASQASLRKRVQSRESIESRGQLQMVQSIYSTSNLQRRDKHLI